MLQILNDELIICKTDYTLEWIEMNWKYLYHYSHCSLYVMMPCNEQNLPHITLHWVIEIMLVFIIKQFIRKRVFILMTITGRNHWLWLGRVYHIFPSTILHLVLIYLKVVYWFEYYDVSLFLILDFAEQLRIMMM